MVVLPSSRCYVFFLFSLSFFNFFFPLASKSARTGARGRTRTRHHSPPSPPSPPSVPPPSPLFFPGFRISRAGRGDVLGGFPSSFKLFFLFPSPSNSGRFTDRKGRTWTCFIPLPLPPLHSPLPPTLPPLFLSCQIERGAG